MGSPPMGKAEAQRWLGIYTRMVTGGQLPIDPKVRS